MSNDSEEIQVEFHNRSKERFFFVYHSFENTVTNLNRRINEYHFQELKKQYAATLEKELQMIAKEILLKYKVEKHWREIDPMFHQFIKNYLHLFIQKANSL